MNNNRQIVSLNFAGHEMILGHNGCCYWPVKKILIVSDLHLEKGSYFAHKGQPLPLTDTRDTLQRLKKEILFFQPDTVICLGDNVHDAQAFNRMTAEDLLLLTALCDSVPNWQWIIGNHDKVEFANHPLKNMQFLVDIIIDNICFTHELQPDKPIQVIGHYHPKISVKRHGVRITGKCFSVSSNKMIMPAFGSYTGGLDVHDKAYRGIFSGAVSHYLMIKQGIFLAK